MNGIPYPDIRRPGPCAGIVLPAALTGPHSAGLGIKFYTGSMFPESYRNVAFIARHGSWNREQRFGYDVAVAKIDGATATIEPFMAGMLELHEERVPQPSGLCVSHGGRLDACIGRTPRCDLPDLLHGTKCRREIERIVVLVRELSSAASYRAGGCRILWRLYVRPDYGVG